MLSIILELVKKSLSFQKTSTRFLKQAVQILKITGFYKIYDIPIERNLTVLSQIVLEVIQLLIF